MLKTVASRVLSVMYKSTLLLLFFFHTLAFSCKIKYSFLKSLDSDNPQLMLHIGAFNIQCLTAKKLENKEISTEILNIIFRYDVVFLQEVMYSHNRTVKRLVQELNGFECRGDVPCVESYSLVVGKPQGQEQFVYLYKKSRVELVQSWLYDEQKSFERQPLIMLFRPKPQGSLIGLIGVHLKPSNAPAEIDTLPQVRDHVKSKYPNAKILMIGDFNADFPYIGTRKRKISKNKSGHFSPKTASLPKLLADPQYLWLVEHQDTTVNPLRIATLDRIVVHKDDYDIIVDGSARPFYYPLHTPPFCHSRTKCIKHDREFLWLDHGQSRLSFEQTAKISDHFPIQVAIYLQPSLKHLHKGLKNLIKRNKSTP